MKPLFLATLLLFVNGGVKAAQPRPVTDARLRNPEPENWLMYRGNYSGWGYSPLKQIDTKNVDDLVPAWTLSTGVDEGHQSPPIVNDGVMYITTPGNQVLALDAASGELLWRYRRELPDDMLNIHPTNRGVALYGDRVYFGGVDAFLVALDAASGELVWETAVENYKHGYYLTLAPLVVHGKVMVGISGGELGVRGFVAAYDADTGEPVWKTYTIPGPGEPGHDTWPGDTWKTGGAPVWVTGTYDQCTRASTFCEVSVGKSLKAAFSGCSRSNARGGPMKSRGAWIIALTSALSCAPEGAVVEDRPNFLVILADDLGYSDLSLLGSEIRTPNIDALAAEGVILTNYHVSPSCSPTRAMLLSGTDAHHAGLGTMAGDADENQDGHPGYEGYLSNRVVTVSNLLRDAGYHTYMAGKWHLGVTPELSPERRGFEKAFATIAGGSSHFGDASPLIEGYPAVYRENGADVSIPEDFYSSDYYTDKLIEYLEDGSEDGHPFFAYAAYTAPHWPLQAPDDYIDRYRGVYDDGYDALRAKRVQNLIDGPRGSRRSCS